MSRQRAILLGLATLGWAGAQAPALALSGGSYTPPGGQAPATAPGGTQGLAGPRNIEDAVRSGQAVGVPRGSRDVRPPRHRGSRGAE